MAARKVEGVRGRLRRQSMMVEVVVEVAAGLRLARMGRKGRWSREASGRAWRRRWRRRWWLGRRGCGRGGVGGGGGVWPSRATFECPRPTSPSSSRSDRVRTRRNDATLTFDDASRRTMNKTTQRLDTLMSDQLARQHSPAHVCACGWAGRRARSHRPATQRKTTRTRGHTLPREDVRFNVRDVARGQGREHACTCAPRADMLSTRTALRAPSL